MSIPSSPSPETPNVRREVPLEGREKHPKSEAITSKTDNVAQENLRSPPSSSSNPKPIRASNTLSSIKTTPAKKVAKLRPRLSINPKSRKGSTIVITNPFSGPGKKSIFKHFESVIKERNEALFNYINANYTVDKFEHIADENKNPIDKKDCNKVYSIAHTNKTTNERENLVIKFPNKAKKIKTTVPKLPFPDFCVPKGIFTRDIKNTTVAYTEDCKNPNLTGKEVIALISKDNKLRELASDLGRHFYEPHLFKALFEHLGKNYDIKDYEILGRGTFGVVYQMTTINKQNGQPNIFALKFQKEGKTRKVGTSFLPPYVKGKTNEMIQGVIPFFKISHRDILSPEEILICDEKQILSLTNPRQKDIQGKEILAVKVPYEQGAKTLGEYLEEPGVGTEMTTFKGKTGHYISDDQKIKEMFGAILRSLSHIHEQGIVHADIKWNNLLQLKPELPKKWVTVERKRVLKKISRDNKSLSTSSRSIITSPSQMTKELNIRIIDFGESRKINFRILEDVKSIKKSLDKIKQNLPPSVKLFKYRLNEIRNKIINLNKSIISENLGKSFDDLENDIKRIEQNSDISRDFSLEIQTINQSLVKLKQNLPPTAKKFKIKLSKIRNKIIQLKTTFISKNLGKSFNHLENEINKIEKENSVVSLGFVHGTPRYQAPELYEENFGAFGWSERDICKADVFSLGIMLFEAVTGEHPFIKSDPNISLLDSLNEYKKIFYPSTKEVDPIKNAFERICKNAHIDIDITNFHLLQDPDFQDLLMKMLNPDPTKRSSSIELLGHPFFKGIQVTSPTGELLSPPPIQDRYKSK